MVETQTNWAGNYTYGAKHWHRPETVKEVQALVRGLRKVRMIGTRHSFNEIADSTEDLISLAHFNKVVSLDRERQTVTVGAGMRYGELGQYLHGEGFAIHNLASLPHISVAGAVATGTHGSGDRNGNLATAVAGLEFVAANGEVVSLNREKDGDQFLGAVVNLGGLGVVTKVTLDITPTFEVRQDVYENLPMAELEAHFDEIFSSAYSVSLFTDWRKAAFNQVWRKGLVKALETVKVEASWFEATPATRALHPLIELSAIHCTEQMGVPGPWHERLPHFRLDFTPSSGEELQTEYLVPRPSAFAAIQSIEVLGEQIAPLLQISEIRTIAADSLWMSPSYQQESVAIHFTWKKDWPAVKALLPRIEEQLAPFQARPHWGKLFTMEPARLQRLYERLPDFRKLLEGYDPEGKFRNAFMDRYVFGAE